MMGSTEAESKPAQLDQAYQLMPSTKQALDDLLLARRLQAAETVRHWFLYPEHGIKDRMQSGSLFKCPLAADIE